MQKKEFNKRHLPKYQADFDACDRRSIDRRKCDCEGYTYISTVGWICRRERSRRKCDCQKNKELASKPSVVLKSDTKRFYGPH